MAEVGINENDIPREVKEIRTLENKVLAWRNSSGMHTLLHDLKSKRDGPSDINDITLALSKGIEEGSSDAMTGVLETAVIAALLLTISIQLLTSPPDAIGNLDGDDWRKLFHVYGWGIMSALGVANIIYARLYSAAISRAVRASDKLRVMLEGNAFTDALYMLYSMYACLCVAIFGDIAAVYSLRDAIVVSLAGNASVFIAVHKGIRFLNAGHIEYGWRQHSKARKDPVDDFLLFETWMKKVEYSRNLSDDAESVFTFRRDDEKEGLSFCRRMENKVGMAVMAGSNAATCGMCCKGRQKEEKVETFAQGISENGQRLLWPHLTSGQSAQFQNVTSV